MAAVSDVEVFQVLPKGDNRLAQITDNVCRVTETPRPPKAWFIALGISLSMLGAFGASIGWAFWTGINVWGNMVPVA